jgi:hypothetical protein
MEAMLPASYRPSLGALLPEDPATFRGPLLPWCFACAYLIIITARSLIHLLAADGGAHSIATMDVAVAGGSNIIAIFGQWGAIQLLLAGLLWVLLLRYRGLSALVLLTLTLEPLLRAVSGHLKPITTVGIAPGARYNMVIIPLLAVMLVLSLCPARRIGD